MDDSSAEVAKEQGNQGRQEVWHGASRKSQLDEMAIPGTSLLMSKIMQAASIASFADLRLSS